MPSPTFKLSPSQSEGGELFPTKRHVVQMQRLGVKGVMITFDVSGIARFFKSLEQQDFRPELRYPAASAYDSDFLKLLGAGPAEGIIIGQALSMYLGEDQASVPEIARFREWMKRVDPSQKIDVFALYGWTSAEMFLNRMEALGPNVTRAGMVEQFSKMGAWDNRGLTTKVDVANKTPPVCEMYIVIKSGKFERLAPAKGFSCDGRFHKF